MTSLPFDCSRETRSSTAAVYVRSPGHGRRRHATIVTFDITTVQLLAPRDWLIEMGVTWWGESTGVYRKPGREDVVAGLRTGLPQLNRSDRTPADLPVECRSGTFVPSMAPESGDQVCSQSTPSSSIVRNGNGRSSGKKEVTGPSTLGGSRRRHRV